jgi:hypothetical protein
MLEARHLARSLPRELRPPLIRREPGSFLVSGVEELRGKPFPLKVHDRYAGAAHWAYGIGWGGLLGLATAPRRLQRPRDAVVAGLSLGAAVWAVEYGAVLPALKLTPPLHRQGVRHIAAALSMLIGYGLVCAAPILALDRLTRPDPWYRRALRSLTG